MSETLSERLRVEPHTWAMADELMREAADTIDALVEALEPFAKAAKLFVRYPMPEGSVASIYAPAAGPEYSLNSDHLIAARAAFAKAKGGDNG